MEMLPTGLPEHIADEEDLARFLTQRNQFNSIIVKPSAFLPNPKDRETSVTRHGLSPIEDLWELGRKAAGVRKLYGAAIFSAHNVRDVRLEIVADEPPPRHAVIRDWPWLEDDPELQKAKQKELALSLSRAAGSPVLCGR